MDATVTEARDNHQVQMQLSSTHTTQNAISSVNGQTTTISATTPATTTTTTTTFTTNIIYLETATEDKYGQAMKEKQQQYMPNMSQVDFPHNITTCTTNTTTTTSTGSGNLLTYNVAQQMESFGPDTPPPNSESQKPRWLSSLHSVIFIITCALAVFIVFRNVLTW